MRPERAVALLLRPTGDSESELPRLCVFRIEVHASEPALLYMLHASLLQRACKVESMTRVAWARLAEQAARTDQTGTTDIESDPAGGGQQNTASAAVSAFHSRQLALWRSELSMGRPMPTPTGGGAVGSPCAAGGEEDEQLPASVVWRRLKATLHEAENHATELRGGLAAMQDGESLHVRSPPGRDPLPYRSSLGFRMSSDHRPSPYNIRYTG